MSTVIIYYNVILTAKNETILTYILYTFIITRVHMYTNSVSCMSMYLNCY